MKFNRSFSLAKSVRLTVSAAFFLTIGVVTAFQTQIPVSVSAQTAGEINNVCSASYINAVTQKNPSAAGLAACKAGYTGSGSGKTIAASCSPFSGEDKLYCELGFNTQKAQADAGVALSDSQLQDRANAACNTGSEAAKAACRNGFREGFNNTKSKSETCGDLRPTKYATAAEKAACEKAFDEGQQLLKDRGGFPADEPDPDCTKSLSSVLSWIACPIIDMGAAFTDFVFKDFVRPMLENVPISTDPNDAGYKAWQGFRLLGNLLLVGTLLAIVYGQIKGGGGR